MRASILACALLATLTADLAAAQFHAYYGRNKIQYEHFDWHVLRTQHFDVYHAAEAGDLAAIAGAEAEAAYRDLVFRFNAELPRRVPLVIYATNLHFRQTNTIAGFIPPGVGGFYEFLKGRVVIPADGDIHQFRRVIRHEVVHVFTYTRLAQVLRDHRKPMQSVPPLWFTEGLAEFWSGDEDHQHAFVMRDAVASNYLVRLEDLHRIGGFLIYKQGEAVCRFIAEEFGDEKLLLLIENAWRDIDFRRVMEYVLRQDFAEIAEQFDRWVRAQHYPEVARAEPPRLASRVIASGAFAGKPAPYTDLEGRPHVAFIANRRGHTNLYTVALDAGGDPLAEPRLLVRGERSHRYEHFHAFESRLDVGASGVLAFATQSGGRDVLHLYDLRRDEAVATYSPGDLVAIYSPTWDPAGRQIAFSGIDARGFANLYTYDPGDDTLTPLTDDPFDDRDPTWGPGGIAFVSDRGAEGAGGARHLFLVDPATGAMRQLTNGDRRDGTPRWTTQDELVFTSSRRQPGGAFGAQNVWRLAPAEQGAREERLTNLTSAAFDPAVVGDDRLVFGAYERGRFSIRSVALDSLDSRSQDPPLAVVAASGEWEHPRLAEGSATRERRERYRRRYSLDVAQGGIATNPVWGTTGGGALAFSDLLGDDRFLVTAYASEVPGGSFLDALNLGVTRIHLGRRINYGYGAFRFSGLRYDRTDPDADATYPVFFEQMAGGVGLLSYPITRFQRVEIGLSAAWNRKEIAYRQFERDAWLLGTTVTFTHDNALYGMNGPVEGWKAQVSLGATGDVRHGNVGYYDATADLRHYVRLGSMASLASWGMVRRSAGREARLHLLGGSWDLRGFPFLGVRGRNMWFTSHELRFSIAEAPSAHLPLLAPFGIANLRGALFVDAARAWNDAYDQRERQLLTGRTLASTGVGLRMNLFGGLVLRYDTGWRFDGHLRWEDRQFFRQFFFGYDF